jgi:hypothetical protein
VAPRPLPGWLPFRDMAIIVATAINFRRNCG